MDEGAAAVHGFMPRTAGVALAEMRLCKVPRATSSLEEILGRFPGGREVEAGGGAAVDTHALVRWRRDGGDGGRGSFMIRIRAATGGRV